MQTLSQIPYCKPLAAALATAAMLAVASPSLAQLAPPQPRQQSMGGEVDRRDLNREQMSFARAQLMRNAEARAEYERALAEVEAAKLKIAADDEVARAAYEAEKARIEGAHAAAMAQWEADVAACRAGDRARCAGG